MKRLSIFGVAALLALAGCGGDDDNSSSDTGTSGGASTSSGGGGGQQLALEADQSQLKFNKDALSAKAGKVTITMTNPSPLQHDIAIEGNGVEAKGETVGQDGKSTVSEDLKAGTYTFYCSVDGHRAAGMKGTLKVS
jgi:plastocyanin